MRYFDQAYDATTYMLIMLCYAAAGWMVIRVMMGADTLLSAVVLMATGSALSAYFIWIRSISGGKA